MGLAGATRLLQAAACGAPMFARPLLVIAILLLMPVGAALTGLSLPEVAPATSSTEPAQDSPGHAPLDAVAITPQGEPTHGQMPEPEPADAVMQALDFVDAEMGLVPEVHQNIRLMLQPNGTLNETGDETHTHAGVGGEGLDAVWNTAFYGTPRKIIMADIDGDGRQEQVVATEIGVTVIDADGKLLWARHIGSPVTGLAVEDFGENGKLEVGLSTSWGSQNPRIEVIDAATGHIDWVYLSQYSVLGMRFTDGDIVAADVAGNHFRLDGGNGELLRSTNVEFLPDVGAVVASHWNLGHYLFEAGDVNGDGVTDTMSAGLYYARASVPFALYSINYYTIIHAVDGASGDILWIHAVMSEPNHDGFTFTLVTALSDIDYNGDGLAEVAYGGYAMRFMFQLSLAGIWYETFLRVSHSETPAVSLPVSSKELLLPLLPLEMYLDVDGVDIDADAGDEVIAIRTLALDALPDTGRYNYERYKAAANADGNPTMVALSDVTIHTDSNLAMWRGDGDVAHLLGYTDDAGINRVDSIDFAGQVVASLDLGNRRATAATLSAQGLAVGTVGTMETYAGNTQLTAFAMRGSPIEFDAADYDGDSYPDALVRSTDGNVYVIDGLTGVIVDALFGDLDVINIEINDGQWRITIVEDFQRAMMVWDPEKASSTWSVEYDYYSGGAGLWYDADGDGVQDMVQAWDYRDHTITVVDGSTGDDLFTETFELPFSFFRPDVGFAMRGLGVDTLVLVDESYGMVAVTGDKVSWSKDFDYFVWDFCGVTADLDGDGADELLTLRDERDIIAEIFDAAGNPKPWAGLPDINWLYECQMERVAAVGGDDVLVGLSYTNSDYDAESGVGRYTGGGWAWKAFGSDDFVAGGLVVLGVDPRGDGTFYYGQEDHVVVARWSDGKELGQFTLNGPRVRMGVVVDLDGSAPSEVVALAADGLVWAMATDAAAVRGALEAEAVAQGKLDAGETIDSVAGKKSPGLSLVVLLGAVLVLARRR